MILTIHLIHMEIIFLKNLLRAYCYEQGVNKQNEFVYKHQMVDSVSLNRRGYLFIDIRE